MPPQHGGRSFEGWMRGGAASTEPPDFEGWMRGGAASTEPPDFGRREH